MSRWDVVLITSSVASYCLAGFGSVDTEQALPVGVRCLRLNSRLIFAAAAASQLNVAAAESTHGEIFLASVPPLDVGDAALAHPQQV